MTDLTILRLKLMMGFSVLFIFALLHIFILGAGGNSEDLSNNDSSNHHHHLHPRGISAIKSFFSKFSAEKNKEQSILDEKNYLEFVASSEPPEGAVIGTVDKDNYYILVTGKCDEVNLNIEKILSKDANKAVRTFLVNKDDFELFEWKTWEEIESGQIPFNPVMICNKFYIVDGEQGLVLKTKDFLKKPNNMQTEVLSLNNDIIEQHLQIDNPENKEGKSSERVEVLKRFTAHNRNCDKAKHVVKLDQGNDKSRAFLKSRTHTVGRVIELSVTGKIPKIVDIGGKLNFKYDQSNLKSDTTSNLSKVLHSVSMEIEIPPNQSCVIEIKSKTFITEVPFSGQLTRRYKDGEKRTTSITGIYDHHESDIETSVNLCTPVKDGPKC
ncbi:natterin-3 [Siphateles boraxobius]|uniref:natterin-3 n=1 Tax=Siphateles boraxobius TaxID=180520 RepID=UPI004063FE6E